MPFIVLRIIIKDTNLKKEINTEVVAIQEDYSCPSRIQGVVNASEKRQLSCDSILQQKLVADP